MTPNFYLIIFLAGSSLYGMHGENPFLHFKKKKKESQTSFIRYFEEKNNCFKTSQGAEQSLSYETLLPDKKTLKTTITINQKICGSKYIAITDPESTYSHLKYIANLEFRIIKNTCFISFLMVNKDFQRQGFGTLLLNELESELRSLKCRKISLMPVDGAQQFYSNHGFIAEKNGDMKKLLH